MQAKNDKTIEKAFKKLWVRKHYGTINGMKTMLLDAVQFALDFHKDGPDPHFGHLESGDNYGWLLIYNGEEVAREIYTTANNEGDVGEQMTGMIPMMPQKGYVGLVMAGMRYPTFFSVAFEEVVLEETIKVTKENFLKYFRVYDK